MVPKPKAAEVVATAITGLRSTVSGTNGSGARASRQPNSSQSAREAPNRPSMGGDAQA
jgi:hypothetical protein